MLTLTIYIINHATDTLKLFITTQTFSILIAITKLEHLPLKTTKFLLPLCHHKLNYFSIQMGILILKSVAQLLPEKQIAFRMFDEFSHENSKTSILRSKHFKDYNYVNTLIQQKTKKHKFAPAIVNSYLIFTKKGVGHWFCAAKETQHNSFFINQLPKGAWG